MTAPALTPAPGDVRRDEFTHAGVGGLSLFAQSWLPSGTAKAALVVMHGLKDHSSRYGELATSLATRGVAVYGFDLRGHGRSEGARVFVDRFDEYVEDLASFLTLVKGKHPGVKVFTLGHSMGGAITTLALLEREPKADGLILSAAALKVGRDVPKPLVAITGFLGKIAPKLGVLALDLKKFSRDPKVVEECEQDPLVTQGKGPARTAAELLGALGRISARAGEVDRPILVLHGSADVITAVEGSRDLVAQAKSADKTLQIYDGLVHDLLHEPEKDRVRDDVTGWIEARL